MNPISPLEMHHRMLSQNVKRVQHEAKTEDEKALKQAAEDFETLFTNQMIKQMRESLQQSELVPQSEGEKVFRGMLDQEYAKSMSKTGALGLSDEIYRQMKEHL